MAPYVAVINTFLSTKCFSYHVDLFFCHTPSRHVCHAHQFLCLLCSQQLEVCVTMCCSSTTKSSLVFITACYNLCADVVCKCASNQSFLELKPLKSRLKV